MPQYYTTEEVIKDKFVFVSYSHRDKELVTDMTGFLIEKGVRLWYDKSFRYHDR